MKKIIFILLVAFFSSNLSAQFANNWKLGNGLGLSFNTTTPSIISSSIASNHSDNTSTISDASGNLLFYTNGYTVWNKNDIIMSNGSGLTGDYTAGQCALIVPIPCDPNKYVIFQTTNFSNPGWLHYSVVDMSLNSGLGDVVAGQKNISLGTGWTEKLCAYYSSSANCYWVLSHKWMSDQFVAFKVDATSIATTSVVSSIGSIHNCGSVGGAHDGMGQLTISPDGSKVVNALTCQDKFEFFDFNLATGVLSNLISITGNGGSAWGTAFSPDSKKVYVNSILGSSIFQYDISVFTSTAIATSLTNIYNTFTGGYNFGYMELGPDGKVYIPRPNTNFISAVNSPNLSGSACNYSFNAVPTGSAQSLWGTSRIAYNIPMPSQPFALLNSVSNITCFGMANGSATVSTTIPGTYTYSWSPGSYSTSIVNNLNPGIYSVTVSDGLCSTVSTLVAVSQPQPISVNITPDQLICNGNSAILNSTVSGGTPAYTYSWSNGSVFSGTSVNPTSQTTYTLDISDANGCINQAVTTVSVSDCTSIQQYEIETTTSVYPNPFSEIIYIKSQSPIDELIVTSVLGTVVKKFKYEKDGFSVSDLANGIYFIQIYNKGRMITSKKVIKTN